MGLLDFFKRKTRDSEENTKEKIRHTFTDTDRLKASLKKMELEVKKQRQQVLLDRLNHLREIQEERQTEEAIAELEAELSPEEEEEEVNPISELPVESDEMKLLNMLMMVMTKLNPNTTQTPLVQQQPVETTSFNPQAVADSLPLPIRKELKKKSAKEIKEIASMYAPDITLEQIEMTLPYL